MTNHSKPPVGPALEASLDRLAITFRGMTAHPDEYNCECHWGSAEDLAHLKMPGLELEPDLLRRTWQAPDWNDHASVLRRVLPQLAVTLVNGGIDDYYLEDVGLSFARGNWQHWPTEQVAAVRAFLHAWWTHCLTAADAAVPAHAALALCSEAAGTLGPWLAAWEAITHPLAD